MRKAKKTMMMIMMLGRQRLPPKLLLLLVYCSLITICSLLLLLLTPNNNKYLRHTNHTSPTNRRLNDYLNIKHVGYHRRIVADFKDHKTEAGVIGFQDSIARQTSVKRTFDENRMDEETEKERFFQNKNNSSTTSRNVVVQHFATSRNNVVQHLASSRNNVEQRHINESSSANPYNDKPCVEKKQVTTTNNNPTRRHNIPRTAHIVWFYPNATAFRFHQALSLLSIQKFFKPTKILFWYDSLPTGAWWLFACQSVAHLLFVPLQRPRRIFNWSVSVPEHQSDVARIQLLKKYGGLYIDLDVILVRDIEPLFSHEVTMGAETPEILGSGFILSRPNATFLELWLESYKQDFDDSDWNKHSTKVPMMLSRKHPELVHVEWFSINRPNWFERAWLFEEGRLWDWSNNYAVHLWYREHKVEYSPESIRRLNTTVAEIFRFIYYQSPKMLPD